MCGSSRRQKFHGGEPGYLCLWNIFDDSFQLNFGGLNMGDNDVIIVRLRQSPIRSEDQIAYKSCAIHDDQLSLINLTFLWLFWQSRKELSRQL
jgi:hypothetical protein